MRIIITLLLALNVVACVAQSSNCEKLKALKLKTYGFRPHGFTEQQLNDKSAELDKFWNLVKSNKAEYAPCLRDLILAENNDSYFCFDAASLLLQVDEQHQYTDAVLTGLQRCDLKDLQLEPYLNICFFLGKQGKDISNLAEKLISYPNAQIPLSAHAIILNAVDASLFLYNVMETRKAETALIKAIEKGNQTAKINAAIVLNILSTTRGDSLVNHLIEQKQLPDSVAKFILKDRDTFIMKPNCNTNISRDEVISKLKSYTPGESESDELLCSAYKNLSSSDADLVRAARQKSTPGLSDEGLSRYFALTRVLITIRHK